MIDLTPKNYLPYLKPKLPNLNIHLFLKQEICPNCYKVFLTFLKSCFFPTGSLTYKHFSSSNLLVTSKNETNSPIHEFKVLQNVFKIKKTRLKMFFKVINKGKLHITPLKSLYVIQHFKFVNWRIRFLMSKTG